MSRPDFLGGYGPSGEYFGPTNPENTTEPNKDRAGDTPNTTPDVANLSGSREKETRIQDLNTPKYPLSNPNSNNSESWDLTDQSANNVGNLDSLFNAPYSSTERYYNLPTPNVKKRANRSKIILGGIATGAVVIALTVGGVSVSANSQDENATISFDSETSTNQNGEQEETKLDIPSQKPEILKKLASDRENLKPYINETAKAPEVLDKTLVEVLDLVVSLPYDPKYGNSEALETEKDRIFEVTRLDPGWGTWVNDLWAEDRANGYLNDGGNYIRRIGVNHEDIKKNSYDLFDSRYAEDVPLRTAVKEYLEDDEAEDSYDGESITVEGNVTVVTLPKVQMSINLVEPHEWQIISYGMSGAAPSAVTEEYHIDKYDDPFSTPLDSETVS